MVMCQTASVEAASAREVDLDAANDPCSWSSGLLMSRLMCSYGSTVEGGVFYLCVLEETLRNELSAHDVNKQHQYAESIKVDLDD